MTHMSVEPGTTLAGRIARTSSSCRCEMSSMKHCCVNRLPEFLKVFSGLRGVACVQPTCRAGRCGVSQKQHQLRTYPQE
jgi:hypothetical protein